MYRKMLKCSIRNIISNPVKFYHTKSDCHVTVPHGKMRGKVCSTPCGKQYYSFEGIPYAKPPLGPLRFRDPQKFDYWCGVLDATKPGNKPVQINPYNQSIEGSEDCLYLNVYTPILPDKQKQSLPVLFFSYGGIGESAGAVITTLLLISKMTQGIFKRIIGLSTVLSDEMIGYNHLEKAKDIASNLGNNINSSEEIDNLLRNCSPEDLTKALMKSVSRANENRIHSFIRPAVENEYDNVEPFLDDYPLQSLRTNNYSKVPALMSVATHESAYLITPPSGQFKFNNDILKFVPSPALEDKDAVQLMDMEKQLKELYFKDKEIGPSTLVEYLDLVSDIDILQFLFYTEKRRNTFNEQDMKLVDMLTEALCNFAKNGKPTWTGQEISWPNYKTDERICLNIDDRISCVPLPEYDRYTNLINILKQKPKIRQQ
ncbi:unnamed protein product [Pieris macdunnoughi]|uniref:Carboxylesterase type B domain-containing protein n=1 Tax=Pieris macdunnoughi TaxID=345717 RepID=A0A821UAY9_9NEOP|nr:unnamed protein product [Pieris macdunnoughi]